MWKAFFCGIGISLLILGAECLVVDRAVFAVPPAKTSPAPSYPTRQYAMPDESSAQGSREWIPPEWAPWTLISVGAVLVLYTASPNPGSG